MSTIESMILYKESSKTHADMLAEERFNHTDWLFEMFDNENVTYIRDSAACGIGKTTTNARLIANHPNQKFLVVVPYYEVLKGNDTILTRLKEFGVKDSEIRIIRGKTEEKYDTRLCLKEKGTEYFPGCSFEYEPDFEKESLNNYIWNDKDCIATCIHKNKCPYSQQYENFESVRIIITTFHLMKRFDDERSIILDESIEMYLKYEESYTKEELDYYNVKLEEPDEINFQKNNKEDNGKVIFYKKVLLDKPIKINSARAYFLNKSLLENENMQAYQFKKSNEVHLFCNNKMYFPSMFRKMIYSCGTTPMNIVYKVTNTEHLQGSENVIGAFEDCITSGWQIYKPKHFDVEKLKNKVLKMNHNWSKSLSEFNLPILIKAIKLLCKDTKVLIVTKLKFEEKINKDADNIQMMGDNIRIVHFGMGRALNLDFVPDVVILYGRWGYAGVQKEVFRRLGFSDEMIAAMEKSEMLQGLHRGRCIIHCDQKIFLISDRNIMNFIPKKDLVSFSMFTGLVQTWNNVDLSKLNKQTSVELTGKSMSGTTCRNLSVLFDFFN